MSEAGLVLAGVLAVLAVLYVARPFLREPSVLALTEERDRALEGLRELEFDHRTGKLSDADYRALVGPLRRRVAEATRALEPRGKERERARAAG